MNKTEINQVCPVCEATIGDSPHIKDADGNYYHLGCYNFTSGGETASDEADGPDELDESEELTAGLDRARGMERTGRSMKQRRVWTIAIASVSMLFAVLILWSAATWAGLVLGDTRATTRFFGTNATWYWFLPAQGLTAAIITGLLGLWLFVAALGVLRRSRSAANWLTGWSIVQIFLVVAFGGRAIYVATTSGAQIQRQGFDYAEVIGSMILTLVMALIWPVFSAVWLLRPSIRAEVEQW